MSLKSKRVERGIMQRKAAETFGLEYQTYQNYENGVTNPDMDTAAMFARYFDCTIGELFDLEEGAQNGLSDDERGLIELYRKLPESGKSAMIATAESLASTLGSGSRDR